MKRGRKSYEESARARLLDLWQRKDEFGEPVGCVATTFTFEAALFEEQCLARFVGMESDAQEDARAYVIEREERLSQTFACVMVDPLHVPTHRSLRWHVLPLRNPSGGIQHAKVTLLVWKKRIRVLVGSANLTDWGYRRNLENMTALDFEPEEGLPLSLLREVLAFLGTIRGFGPGTDSAAGPQPALASFLATVGRQVAGWTDQAWPRGAPQAAFVPVVPGARDVFSQLGDLWKGPPPTTANIVSPFYDDGTRASETLAAFEQLMIQKGACEIDFVCPGHRGPDGSVELEIPECLVDTSRNSVTHSFFFVPPNVEEPNGDQETRPLHSKILSLERDERAVWMFGSSNFTAAGSGIGRVSNIEANLVYVLPDVGDPFAKVCSQCLPPCEGVDLDEDVVRFKPVGDRTPEAEGRVPLPVAFGSATFKPTEAGGELWLEIGERAPLEFTVHDSAGNTLLTAASWGAENGPTPAVVPWTAKSPPSHLIVSWPDDAREPLEAIWTVNVSDLGELPPPEELRSLALEELLEILTSARPFYETASRILRRREGKGRDNVTVLDPHKKVDTRNFLLRRMRRIAGALEGLRERLERPVYSADALRWRLHGPFGPVALARRLALEEGEGAAFMITEVALTVHALRMDAQGDVRREDVRAEVQGVVKQLESLLEGHPAPDNLAAYVRKSFGEMAS